MQLGQEPRRPKVGLGVIVVKDKKVLVGKRRGSHGAGLIAFPGGHVEWWEEYEDTINREIMEETGMKVKFRPVNKFQPEAFTTNNIMVEDDRHYITIFVIADWVSGEAENLDPEKCEGWEWLTLDELIYKVSLSSSVSQHHWIPVEHLLHWREVIGV